MSRGNHTARHFTRWSVGPLLGAALSGWSAIARAQAAPETPAPATAPTPTGSPGSAGSAGSAPASSTQTAPTSTPATATEEAASSAEAPATTEPGAEPNAAASTTTEPAPGPNPALYGAYPNPAEVPEPTSTTPTTDTPVKKKPTDEDRVFSEDWWVHTRPALELHGNFRVRAEMYHQFHLGRVDPPGTALWPRPLDDSYVDTNGTLQGAEACTPNEGQSLNSTSSSPSDANIGCINPTQMGANMRFRVEPAIIISDNLRVRSQIDLFDNLVMGSTSLGNVNYPAATGGYAVAQRGGYYPVSASSWSQGSPVSGLNTVQDAIAVKRAWAEYETPVGQARFGRMPDHWGLGLVHNAGDDIDGDYQSTVDRIAFFTGLESLQLFAGAAWDFPYEGPTSAAFTTPGGQAYDVAQFDDVSAMNLLLFRRVNPQLERMILRRGGVVVNGGLYLTYAYQRIANDVSGASATCDNGAAAIDCQPGEAAASYVRRGFEQWTPDLFAELKYKGFYAGVEAVTNQGTIQNTSSVPGDSDYDNTGTGRDGWRINQWAVATEIEQKLVEDRLLLGFYFGWASGDGDVEGLVPPAGGEVQIGDRSFDTFRFHPGYRVDLILNRNILSRVQGSYYFKPLAQYDFIRQDTGMRLGGRAEAIWTRASNFMQAPGHQADLGIELDATVYYQSKDGSLNDDPTLLGGFYAMMQYGVFFPLSGLGYQRSQQLPDADSRPRGYDGLQTAQMLRLFLGVAY